MAADAAGERLLDCMYVLDVLLDAALQKMPFGDAHAQWADTLIALGDTELVSKTIEAWLPGARKIGRCELLCALARARLARGLSADAGIAEAQALAEAEWSETERAWTALSKTFLCAGDLGSALDAWTHPENAYRFPERDAVSATAVALRRAGRWSDLDRLLCHVGPGHDQAVILDAVMQDALERQELGPALQAMWWIPESLREDALLKAIRGAVEGGSQRSAGQWRRSGTGWRAARRAGRARGPCSVTAVALGRCLRPCWWRGSARPAHRLPRPSATLRWPWCCWGTPMGRCGVWTGWRGRGSSSGPCGRWLRWQSFPSRCCSSRSTAGQRTYTCFGRSGRWTSPGARCARGGAGSRLLQTELLRWKTTTSGGSRSRRSPTPRLRLEISTPPWSLRRG